MNTEEAHCCQLLNAASPALFLQACGWHASDAPRKVKLMSLSPPPLKLFFFFASFLSNASYQGKGRPRNDPCQKSAHLREQSDLRFFFFFLRLSWTPHTLESHKKRKTSSLRWSLGSLHFCRFRLRQSFLFLFLFSCQLGLQTKKKMGPVGKAR